MGPEERRELKQSQIRLFSRLKPRNIFPGEWESAYTGEGIEFAAIEPFEPGDDLRDLDLHALAQSGEEQIIHRVAARQMRVYLWVDFSGSMQRSASPLLARKPQIRDIAIGLILFSALNAYSPVGLCAFNERTRHLVPARSGERHCWEILEWVLDQEQQLQPTGAGWRAAIRFLMQSAPPRSLVFLVSDFMDAAFAGDFAGLLRPAADTFDLVPIVIRDPLEVQGTLGRAVRISVRDSEGDGAGEIYLTPQRLAEMQRVAAGHLRHLEQGFRALGLGHVVLHSPSVEDSHRVLSAFFQSRALTR